jgi:hypothetical protein
VRALLLVPGAWRTAWELGNDGLVLFGTVSSAVLLPFCSWWRRSWHSFRLPAYLLKTPLPPAPLAPVLLSPPLDPAGGPARSFFLNANVFHPSLNCGRSTFKALYL